MPCLKSLPCLDAYTGCVSRMPEPQFRLSGESGMACLPVSFIDRHRTPHPACCLVVCAMIRL